MPGSATGDSNDSQNTPPTLTAARHLDLDPNRMDNPDEQRVMSLLRRFKNVNTKLAMKNRRLIGELTDLNMSIVNLRVDNQTVERQLDDLRALGPEVGQEIDRLMKVAAEQLDLDRKEERSTVEPDSPIGTKIEVASEDEAEAGEPKADEEVKGETEDGFGEEEDEEMRAEFDRQLQLEMAQQNGDDKDEDAEEDEKRSAEKENQSLLSVFRKLVTAKSPPPKLVRMDRIRAGRLKVVGQQPPKPDLMLSAQKENEEIEPKKIIESSQKQSKEDQPKKNVKGSSLMSVTCGIDGCQFKCRRMEQGKLMAHQNYHHQNRLTSKKVVGTRSGSTVYGCDIAGCEFQSLFTCSITRHKKKVHFGDSKSKSNDKKKIHLGQSKTTSKSIDNRVWVSCAIDGCKFKCRLEEKGKFSVHQQNNHQNKLTSKVVFTKKSRVFYACDLPGCNYQSQSSSHVNRHKRTVHRNEFDWKSLAGPTPGQTNKKKKSVKTSEKKVVQSNSSQSVDNRVYHHCPFEGCEYKSWHRGHFNEHVRNPRVHLKKKAAGRKC